MVNHYEGYVIFQDIEDQLRENILNHFLHCSFSWNLHYIEKYLLSNQNYLLEAFKDLPNHVNYFYRNIEYMTILYFYHNLSCIRY